MATADFCEPKFTAISPLQKTINLGTGEVELGLTQTFQDSKQDTLNINSNISVNTLGGKK